MCGGHDIGVTSAGAGPLEAGSIVLVARLKGSSRSPDPDDGFEATGNLDDPFDGPTQLPDPWSPPPDPEFPTGAVAQLEAVDLRAGVEPGVEAADSAQPTTRLSTEEVAELIAIRTRARPRRARPAAETPEPPRSAAPARATTAGEMARRLIIVRRWQLLNLAIAFAIGVLTGVLAMR